MKKILVLIVIIILFAIPSKAQAAQLHAEASAQLVSNIPVKSNVLDVRAKALRNVFARHNSPLVDEAENYVKYADMYGVDWKLLPAISGLESSFGLHLMAGSYNAYGWANGGYRFTSWEDSIEHVTMTLRQKYVDRGIDTLPEISRVYCPPNPQWWYKVKFFMEKIDAQPIADSQASNTAETKAIAALSPFASK